MNASSLCVSKTNQNYSERPPFILVLFFLILNLFYIPYKKGLLNRIVNEATLQEWLTYLIGQSFSSILKY